MGDGDDSFNCVSTIPFKTIMQFTIYKIKPFKALLFGKLFPLLFPPWNVCYGILLQQLTIQRGQTPSSQNCSQITHTHTHTVLFHP